MNYAESISKVWVDYNDDVIYHYRDSQHDYNESIRSWSLKRGKNYD